MLMLTPCSLVGWLITALQLCPLPMRLPSRKSPPPVKHTQPWPASVASAPSLSHPPSPQYSAQVLSTMLPKLWQASAHTPAALATSLPACLCVGDSTHPCHGSACRPLDKTLSNLLASRVSILTLGSCCTAPEQVQTGIRCSGRREAPMPPPPTTGRRPAVLHCAAL